MQGRRHLVPEGLRKRAGSTSTAVVSCPQSGATDDRVRPVSTTLASMDEATVAELLEQQDGVLSRRQVLACGGDDNDIERLIRRRIWARIHDGVYVHHTGSPSWTQRAWAAVLYCWPAVLTGSSALRAFGVRTGRQDDDAPIQVAVDARRFVTPCEGVVVTRLRDFADVALTHLCPPRVRLEHALLTVASGAADDGSAVGVLADSCQSRRTTAPRLLEALRGRRRLPRRGLLLEILEDVATGAFSVLERLYLRDVERRHGLPPGTRQRRIRRGSRSAYRDVEYREFRTVVELDGRLWHEASADHWADLDRDIESAEQGDLTIRAGMKQVLDPCRLATAVARILTARGWPGRPHPCRPGCPVEKVCASFPAPGAGDLAQTGG